MNELLIHKPIPILTAGIDKNITFFCGEREVLRLAPDGGFFVEGRKVTTDQEVCEAFKNWLTDMGIL